MASMEDLVKRVDKLIIDVPTIGNERKKAAARVINFDLLQITPVDQGIAMSNWIVQNGDASDELRPAFVPSPTGKSVSSKGKREWTNSVDPEVTRSANFGPANDLAQATIDQAQSGVDLHITNNLPYIQALDQGHSSQAANFVDRAIILGTDRASRD